MSDARTQAASAKLRAVAEHIKARMEKEARVPLDNGAPASSRRGVFDPSSYSPMDGLIDFPKRSEWLARYLAWRTMNGPEEGLAVEHTPRGWRTQEPWFDERRLSHDASVIVQHVRARGWPLVKQADRYMTDLRDACTALAQEALDEDAAPEVIAARRNVPPDYARCARRLIEAYEMSRSTHPISKLTSPSWPLEVQRASQLADAIERRADELLREERRAPPPAQPSILARWSALADAADALRLEVNTWIGRRHLDGEELGLDRLIDRTRNKLKSQWDESFPPITREAP